MREAKNEKSVAQDQEPFMTPEKFEALLRHAEVVLDPQTGPQGNLMRLADTPIDEGGLPVKRYRISVSPEMTQEQLDKGIVRYLGIVKRDLVAPYDRSLSGDQEDMDQGVEEFVRDNLDLVRQTPVLIFESGFPTMETTPTTGLKTY